LQHIRVVNLTPSVMMKALPQILLLAALALATNVHAQNGDLNVTDADGNQVNGTTIHVNAGITGDSAQILESDLSVEMLVPRAR
jgi:hypothetical protein